MADRSPELIERAAARLRRPAPQDQGENSRALRNAMQDAGAVPLDANHANGVASDPPHAARAGRPLHEDVVSISQTTLASHGIALPSSGTSRTVEEFRALKREVIANIARTRDASTGLSNRIVLVTSANPGEGKTFTATNLALALASEKDTHVLLMDADAYRQSMLGYLGIFAEKGWLDFVSEKSARLGELILHTNLPNFSVLPAGKERDQIPELISSSRMADLFEQLMSEDPARLVVVDAVPCLTSTEPSILAGLAGQTLFVVAAHETAQDQIEASLRLLKASPRVNLMLNKMHPVLTDHFKGYGYTYGAQR
ncbi:MAG TPA: AAA family ATPase [Rhizomicrobium sp.]|nr:AAA family ATPase [Rhizomicrobium sp.]